MKIVLPTLFSQMDVRWGSKLLGFNTDPKFDIYNYGCLLTDFAMVAEYYGYDTDPSRLNDLLMGVKGFATGSGDYVKNIISKVFSKMDEKWTVTPDLLTDAQIGEIKTALDAGYPVICQLDYNPKTVQLDSHFVIIIAYDPADENNFTIADPLGGKIHSLKDYLGFFYQSARKTIVEYCVVTGPVPAADANDTMVIKKSIFPGLVHGSSQWDLTVHSYLTPTTDPTTTDFPAVQAVVGGFKSAATQANNALTQCQQDLAVAKQESVNAGEALALEKSDRQTTEKALNDRISALFSTQKTIDGITTSYEGQLAAKQLTIDGLLSDKHNLSIQLAKAQSESVNSIFDRILTWLRSVRK